MLAQYEAGSKVPSVEALMRIADELGRPVGYFFEEGDSV
jgi:transcriptional regulator with XRE-family HTH domain